MQIRIRILHMIIILIIGIDIVVGPVANDDLALLFRQFSNGMITVDVLIREMEFKKLTDQYSFHTEEAAALLRKVDEYIVKR